MRNILWGGWRRWPVVKRERFICMWHRTRENGMLYYFEWDKNLIKSCKMLIVAFVNYCSFHVCT